MFHRYAKITLLFMLASTSLTQTMSHHCHHYYYNVPGNMFDTAEKFLSAVKAVQSNDRTFNVFFAAESAIIPATACLVTGGECTPCACCAYMVATGTWGSLNWLVWGTEYRAARRVARFMCPRCLNKVLADPKAKSTLSANMIVAIKDAIAECDYASECIPHVIESHGYVKRD